ncbi:hypothetical protein, partial [Campylobacter jejuni]|uniref:hypothetical protein n=1 Tax=Campylobacter jejuni TaxID=197 RepID=UPI001F093C36
DRDPATHANRFAAGPPPPGERLNEFLNPDGGDCLPIGMVRVTRKPAGRVVATGSGSPMRLKIMFRAALAATALLCALPGAQARQVT